MTSLRFNQNEDEIKIQRRSVLKLFCLMWVLGVNALRIRLDVLNYASGIYLGIHEHCP